MATAKLKKRCGWSSTNKDFIAGTRLIRNRTMPGIAKEIPSAFKNSNSKLSQKSKTKKVIFLLNLITSDNIITYFFQKQKLLFAFYFGN